MGKAPASTAGAANPPLLTEVLSVTFVLRLPDNVRSWHLTHRSLFRSPTPPKSVNAVEHGKIRP